MEIETPSRKRRGATSERPQAAQAPGRRERNKREKRARIVAAARALFRAKGFDATTTQEIAEAADIGTGTLFLYAKSKEDLLILVFLDEVSELIGQVHKRVPGDAPLLDQAETLFHGIIDYHAADITIARALIREVTFLNNPERADDVNGIAEAIIGKLAEFVSTALTRGDVHEGIDPLIAGRCLFAAYYQQLLMWLSGYATKEHFLTQLHGMLTLIVAGFEPKSTPPRPTKKRKNS